MNHQCCHHCTLSVHAPHSKGCPVKEGSTTGYVRDQQFFSELEVVLDEYFPKVEEEGEEKRLMKRGEALMLFSAANMIHSKLLALQLNKL